MAGLASGAAVSYENNKKKVRKKKGYPMRQCMAVAGSLQQRETQQYEELRSGRLPVVPVKGGGVGADARLCCSVNGGALMQSWFGAAFPPADGLQSAVCAAGCKSL
jgi:hypothetical protein